MPINYQSSNTDYIKWPSVGEEIKFTIKESEEVRRDPNDKFNFKTKKKVNVPGIGDTEVEVNAGYHYILHTSDGKKISLNRWPVFYAFSRAAVQDGDTIKVSHPNKGEWKVEVLNRTTGAPAGATNKKSEAWDE